MRALLGHMVQVHRLSPKGRVTYTAVSTVLKTDGVVKDLGVGTSLYRHSIYGACGVMIAQQTVNL